MLKKLIKYEWKATIRTLLPLYLGVILIAVINRILWSPWISYSGDYARNADPGVAQGVAMTVYITLIVASFVVTFVILIQRFYKSLLGDEGYLMFTLPVTPAQNIWAKSIIAVIMNVFCAIATMISVLVLATNMEMWGILFRDFGKIVHVVFQDANIPVIMLEFFVAMVIATVSSILFIYACIAIGHLAKRHRVAMAVVAYFVLTTVLQTVGTQLMILCGRSEMLQNFFSNMQPTAALHFMMIMMIVSGVVIGAGSFIGTNYILSKKLNLE